MFSPAGQAWLHGGRRSTYSGRFVRHAPVLLARLEPTSSVMAYGLSMGTVLLQQPELFDVAIGHSLDLGDAREIGVFAEQMGVALLQREILGDRHLPPYRRARNELAV